jgi:hypothetical protein
VTLAVVGAAALTPLGDLPQTLAAIAAGRSAGAVDASGRLVAALGAVPSAARQARIVGSLPVLALDVARRASVDVPPDARSGVFVAYGGMRAHWGELGPAMAEQHVDASRAWQRGLARMHPLWALRFLSNGAHALIAAELGAVGDGATFSGPASAASALVAAELALADGTIDHAIVVALDDLTTAEAATELASRHPTCVPGAGVVAIVVAARSGATQIRAVDGIDPEHAEPAAAAIAAVRARLPRAEADVSYAARTGWLGAASLLLDAVIAAQTAGPRCVTITAAASPGQIGVIRVEVAR